MSTCTYPPSGPRPPAVTGSSCSPSSVCAARRVPVARYALSLWLPARGAAGLPWGLFAVNVSGCALIGVLMVLIGEGGRDARAPALLRPFPGVGVLGGFTTFSTYAVDAARLLRAGPHVLPSAVAYLGGTLLCALVAVWEGAAATRALLEVRGR